MAKTKCWTLERKDGSKYTTCKGYQRPDKAKKSKKKVVKKKPKKKLNLKFKKPKKKVVKKRSTKREAIAPKGKGSTRVPWERKYMKMTGWKKRYDPTGKAWAVKTVSKFARMRQLPVRTSKEELHSAFYALPPHVQESIGGLHRSLFG